MATLVFNAEEIAPRELKPELYELEGISREVRRGPLQALRGLRREAKRDPRQARRRRPLEAGNQVYSEIRALKVDLSFAIGGVKNHEIYFEHLGGEGGDPSGPIGDLIERDFGSRRRLARRPEGDRHGRSRLGVDGLRLGRGPPLQLHRRCAEHVSRSGTRRPWWRSTSTSTRTSSTTAPTGLPTSTSSSTTSTGRP